MKQRRQYCIFLNNFRSPLYYWNFLNANSDSCHFVTPQKYYESHKEQSDLNSSWFLQPFSNDEDWGEGIDRVKAPILKYLQRNHSFQLTGFYMIQILLMNKSITAWKVSKYGVFCGPYFPVFGPNTGKHGTEETRYLDTLNPVNSFVKADRIRGKWFFCSCWNINIQLSQFILEVSNWCGQLNIDLSIKMKISQSQK